ncbi:hypothetical protein HELRODRAFT_170829 [Helobdella robusta]|uniref:Uncharacterized protein n=1 Tax=Helobdella robusta TaxID=6412 RepID=T1F3H3_HELRO|nr:hypothetical protein HELRODRAFT_170829 [Helobdella robusta]ESO06807.1 hypothetical protein HELRODRAFT_170829 [Helobdella robusta]
MTAHVRDSSNFQKKKENRRLAGDARRIQRNRRSDLGQKMIQKMIYNTNARKQTVKNSGRNNYIKHRQTQTCTQRKTQMKPQIQRTKHIHNHSVMQTQTWVETHRHGQKHRNRKERKDMHTGADLFYFNRGEIKKCLNFEICRGPSRNLY